MESIVILAALNGASLYGKCEVSFMFKEIFWAFIVLLLRKWEYIQDHSLIFSRTLLHYLTNNDINIL